MSSYSICFAAANWTWDSGCTLRSTDKSKTYKAINSRSKQESLVQVTAKKIDMNWRAREQTDEEKAEIEEIAHVLLEREC